MLWALELALAAGTGKGQCAEWSYVSAKVDPYQGPWAGWRGRRCLAGPREKRYGNKSQMERVFDPSYFLFVLCPI